MPGGVEQSKTQLDSGFSMPREFQAAECPGSGFLLVKKLDINCGQTMLGFIINLEYLMALTLAGKL